MAKSKTLDDIKRNRASLEYIEQSIKETVGFAQKIQLIAADIDQKHLNFMNRINEVVDRICASVSRLEATVTEHDHILRGIDGDPNNRGVVNRCYEHAEDIESLKAAIKSKDMAAAVDHGKEIQELRLEEHEEKAEEKKFRWWSILAPIAGGIFMLLLQLAAYLIFNVSLFQQ